MKYFYFHIITISLHFLKIYKYKVKICNCIWSFQSVKADYGSYDLIKESDELLSVISVG